MSTNSSQYIIAIGASAGGIEEIQHFFDNTPLDGVAYVIVQHLSPDFKSRMVELLAKHSKLKVREAEENMLVEDNQVYLIPSKKFMTIRKDRLHLTEKTRVAGPHLTINTFFKSLAAERKEKAIGIILSGLGSDGTEGAKAIHEKGGIIIAREPATSEFSSMPSNVIESGVVNYILEPELMPAAIEYYVKNDGALLPQASTNKKEEKVLVAIIDLIKDRLPLDFSDYKQTTILRRIKRRAASKNLPSLQSYLAFCKLNDAEVEALAKDFLISVTAFFRDKEAYDFLQKSVIPEIIKNTAEGDEIKFWIAGCATGEEAYSLAILLKEKLTGKYKNQPVKIFATDIDTAALAYAGKGKYSNTITKYVSPQRLAQFFIKDNNGYVVAPEIRKMIIFAQHDLVKNPPYCNMNLISCRNLLIYMTPPLQKKIYQMLHFGLKRDGYLFLGSSENAQPISSSVELIHKKWKIYKNVRLKRSMFADAFSLPDFAFTKKNIPTQVLDDDYRVSSHLTEVISQEIITELGYMLVCINENYKIIKTFGNTDRYLLQKNFNLDLADLLPERLSLSFKTAARKALKLNKKVSVSNITFQKKDVTATVSLIVKPLPVKAPGHRLLIVLFGEDTLQQQATATGQAYSENLILSEYTKNIEEELQELKIELYNTNEKLDASKENLQSYNEELLSANEEMQSTNEEMQSVNEELHTINSDYQLKNKELLELNDELNNYFRSNPNGQLYVNKDLLLMKYSPGTVKHINLRESDLGRPISNITTNFKFGTIESDIKEVIRNGGKINKEVEATDGKWYQLMTMPYIHQADDKIHGAIMTFNDITQLKQIQIELDKTNKNLMKINNDLDNFVHTASHDLLGPLSNIQFSISAINAYSVTDTNMKQTIDVIHSSVKKFTSLIQDMAAIGKVETGLLEMENIDIKEMINDIRLSIQESIDKNQVTINTDLQVKEIYFSKKNLRSILYNLINNAIKFRSPGQLPLIQISSGKKNDQIFIKVKDNGMGMAEKDLETIFQISRRLHQNIEGQGLGLFLVKKIIDAAGGSITVQSKPGKGSTFSVLLQSAAKG